MKKLICCIAASMAIACTYAQGDEHLETDRPGENQTPHTTKVKYVQVETGVYYEKTSSFSHMVSHPTTLIRYGVSNRFELRAQVDFTTLTERYMPNDQTTTGIPPVEIGFKAAICEEHAWIPKTTIFFQTGIPTIASKAFQQDHLAPQLRLLMENSLSKCVSISYNAGLEWDGTETTPSWVYTFTPEVNVSKNLQAFVEAFGYFNAHEGAQHTLDGGLEYFIHNNVAVDIASGIGLSKGSPDFFFTVGGSVRF